MIVLIVLSLLLFFSAAYTAPYLTSHADEVGDETSSETGTIDEESSRQEAADRAAAEYAEQQIMALPDPDKITLGHESLLNQVQKVYEALTETQKGYVSKAAYDRLGSCWAAFDVLKESSKASQEAADESSRKESEEASRKASEEESRSIEESIKASESESASIEESERQSSIEESESIERSIEESESEEEAKKVHIDGYTVFADLKGIKAPEGFFADTDEETYDKPVEAFYSAAFKEYVYYAEKAEKKGYYVYNRMKDSLIPFVTFSGAGGNKYIVSAPDTAKDLPATVRRETRVDVGSLSAGSTIVPGFTADGADGKSVVILYLISDKGEGSYYIYDNTGGSITLTPYVEPEPESETETEEEETTEETTSESEEESVEPTKEPGGSGIGVLRNYLIWLIIIGVIIVLLIVAIIVVSRMSRRQEAEENELDLNKNVFDRTPAEEFESSYSPKASNGVEPFETSFENAFPEEMHVRGDAAQAAGNAEEAAAAGAAVAAAAVPDSLNAPTERLPEIGPEPAAEAPAPEAAEPAAAEMNAAAEPIAEAEAAPAEAEAEAAAVLAEENAAAEEAAAALEAAAAAEAATLAAAETAETAEPAPKAPAKPAEVEIDAFEKDFEAAEEAAPAADTASDILPEQAEFLRVEETLRQADVPEAAETVKAAEAPAEEPGFRRTGRKAKYKKVLDESDFEVIDFND
ncbi:MAG: hypothetical protein IJM76_10015 [Lachnospiraceae bacterium]|nr:hypothetical protein [Lachnospiraceae bacterium]